MNMASWSEALSTTVAQDRKLREMGEKPLQQIISSAKNGDLESLNYLLRQTSLRLIQNKSEKTCSQLFHFGRKCDGLYCDGALASCVEICVDAIYGTSSDLSEQPQRSIAIQLKFDSKHAIAIREQLQSGKTTGKTVLQYWDDKLKLTDNHTEVWLRQSAKALNRGGWVTDCRRKWNQTRNLLQRIDQENYFYRNKKLTGLGEAFVQEWNKKTIDSALSQMFGVSEFHPEDSDKIANEFNLLITWLGAIYDDACEPWRDGDVYNCKRIFVNLIYKNILTSENAHSSEVLKFIELICVTIEKNLEEAYAAIAKEPTICQNLNEARTMTRVVSELIESDVMEILEARSHLDGTGKR
jgi:5'(3')-deoxyribonucleotidase